MLIVNGADSTMVVGSVTLWAIHLRVGLNPCGPLPPQNFLWVCNFGLATYDLVVVISCMQCLYLVPSFYWCYSWECIYFPLSFQTQFMPLGNQVPLWNPRQAQYTDFSILFHVLAERLGPHLSYEVFLHQWKGSFLLEIVLLDARMPLLKEDCHLSSLMAVVNLAKSRHNASFIHCV